MTSVEDARFALECGADYIGLIFAESPRRVDRKRALEIRRALPDARIVGVFRDAVVDAVVDTARLVGVDMVQLHGAETPGYCAEVRNRAAMPIIKSFTAGDIPDTTRLSTYETTSFFLFDLDKGDDGTRATRDRMWLEAARVRRQGFRVFLAGALDYTNVRGAIETTRPFCVDVCRGVEREPGIKDRDSVRRFIAEVAS
jgi:phosphoribosylanthranilate isomerase